MDDEEITSLDERIGDSIAELYNFGHATLDFLLEMSKLLRLLRKPDVRFDVAVAEGRRHLDTAKDFTRAYAALTNQAIHLLEQSDSPIAAEYSEQRDAALVRLTAATAAFDADRPAFDLYSDDFVHRMALLGFATYSGNISEADRAVYTQAIATIIHRFADLHAALSEANMQAAQTIVALVNFGF